MKKNHDDFLFKNGVKKKVAWSLTSGTQKQGSLDDISTKAFHATLARASIRNMRGKKI